MGEEDNFDIDIYGDGGEDFQEEGQVQDQSHKEASGVETSQDLTSTETKQEDGSHVPDTSLPKPPIVQDQKISFKREDGPDGRHVEPGATCALRIIDLSWWTTDDDVRSWTKEANCEDELKELTFYEQKVNGKSKGEVFLLFETPQAATATKLNVETFGENGKQRQKVNASYTNPLSNPFKTLPKDGPMRNQNRNTSGGNFSQNNHQGGFNPNYRGRGRGNFNNNSGGGGGGYNNNNSRGGYQQGGSGMGGGFQGQMGGFQGGMNGGMNNFGGGGGYGNRGGMMGGRGGGGMVMRGGRGGMQPNMMGGGMPMGGGMMPNMGMPMMNPMQGGGFQGGYNPGFYPQGSPGHDQGWSGSNKRPRQE